MFDVLATAGFDFLSESYMALFARSAATAFQHPVWLDRLYHHLAPRFGAQPVVVAARDEGDRLSLVLPLLRRRRGGLRVLEYADLGVSDYVSPVCSEENFRRICADDHCLRSISDSLGAFDVLRVPKMRADGLDLGRLLIRSSLFEKTDHAHSIELDRPFSDWREAHLDPSYRRELDKKRRKLNRAGAWEVKRVHGRESISEAFRTALALRASRFETRSSEDVLADAAAMAFYVDVATAGTESDFARTYVMTLDGRTIAMLFGLHHRERLLVVISAFDAEFKSFSLGSLLFEDVVSDCIQSGDKVFDLTVGDEGYKKTFGATATDLSTVVKPGSLIGHAASLVLSRKWTRRLVKGLVH